jgi:hypothetical protein
MKISTRQYAKRQVKWLRGKLLPAVLGEKSRAELCGEDAQVDMYVLDATGKTQHAAYGTPWIKKRITSLTCSWALLIRPRGMGKQRPRKRCEIGAR